MGGLPKENVVPEAAVIAAAILFHTPFPFGMFFRFSLIFSYRFSGEFSYPFSYPRFF